MSAVADTLAAWRAAEQAARLRLQAGPGAGVVTPQQVAGKSGLQLMQAMLNGEVPYPSIADTLDFVMLQVEEGKVVFQGTPQTKHLNPMGTVHGGWYATLLDSAVGCAVHTCMPAGRGYTTAELSVNLVRGAKLNGEPLQVTGQVLHVGRQLATAEGRITDAAGRLYAHATTTCLVFELPS
jgi:uncharacterized protein (TIGR00369 family)